MAPEQMQSARDVDARTDIWAMGVVLYELVTGRAPFAGEAVPEVVANALLTTPLPMRGFLPNVPEQLERVILRCLEKDRAKRYPNVAELAQALMEFGPRRSRNSVERISRVVQATSLSAKPATQSPEPLPAPQGTIPPVGWTASRTAVRKAGTFGVAALVGVLSAGAAVIVVLVLQSRQSPDPSAKDNPLASAAQPEKANVLPPITPPIASAIMPAAETTVPPAASSSVPAPLTVVPGKARKVTPAAKPEEPAPTPTREERSPQKPVESDPFARLKPK